MNPDVLQFQCGACQSVLTVPAHLAGVTGPCPICGSSVTSPSAAPEPAQASVPLFLQPQAPAPEQPTSGLVMPNPHSIAQHLSPLGGGPQPNQGFLNPQPTQEPAPQWQQPGLGQTLLGGAQPSFPQSPTTGLGGLPPRRSPGQAPLSGALNQPAATWGSQPQGFPPAEPLPGQFPQRSQGAPGHSSLIPGSPTLPVLGNPSQDQVPQSSLLGRDLPSAPPAPAPQSTSPGLTLPAPQAPRTDMRTRPSARKILVRPGSSCVRSWRR